MKVILPLRAEFGLKLWWFVPAVHAIEAPDGEKVVYIEEGEQALFPSASRWLEVPRQSDGLRRNRYSRDREFVDEMREDAMMRFGEDAEILEPGPSWPRLRFVPKPLVHQRIRPDVVVAPRKRKYGAEKNWGHWSALTLGLRAAGFEVFAGGAPDSSYDVPCDCAWTRSRYLDATIEAVRAARLVIATDAGLAHLAVLCGTPLLMITHGEGLVAPGPSVDEAGKEMDAEYWPVKVERYREANHLDVPIRFLHHSWFDPGLVLDVATRTLGAPAERRGRG